MRRWLRLTIIALLTSGCHGNDPAIAGGSAVAGSTTIQPKPSVSASPPSGAAIASATPERGPAVAPVAAKPASDKATASATEPNPASPASASEAGGHDFTPEARALLVVGACNEGPVPEGIVASDVAAHCEAVMKAQAAYAEKWVKPAREFFSELVPKGVPKRVVYPFAGGDLSTALTVYPDADEITNISLEPAGDPRAIDSLRGKELRKALEKVAYELKFLYRVNFSNTLNMIDAMRGGALPAELIFALSALKIHGFEVVALRYFAVNEDGTLRYLSDDDVAKAPAATESKPQARNAIFSNAELQFRRPGGRTQVYRHIRNNLGDADGKGIGPGLKRDPRILRHLEAKGQVAAMTKAASYLLSWDSFSLIRGYLTAHAQWMVSDATGVAPRWGKPAGYEYETYGYFHTPHIPAGNGIAKDWRGEFNAQTRRELGFRFGYPDKSNRNHLVVMRKKV